jgi:phage terminase large subunit-like protein
MSESRAELLASMTDEDREQFLGQLSPDEALAILYDWHTWARPNQLQPQTPPEGVPWYVWMLLGGRGMGKTKTGAETLREWAEATQKGEPERFAIIGQTAADVRDVTSDSDHQVDGGRRAGSRHARLELREHFELGAVVHSACDPEVRGHTRRSSGAARRSAHGHAGRAVDVRDD